MRQIVTARQYYGASHEDCEEFVRVARSDCVGIAPISAHADSVTFVGASPTGIDQVTGASYALTGGPSTGGLFAFKEGAGTQPDPTQQPLFNSSFLADANSFTLTITGPASAGILPLDRNFGNFFGTFSANGNLVSIWTASENATGTAINFNPGSADDVLLAGERYGLNITFLGSDIPAGFATLSFGSAKRSRQSLNPPHG